MTRIGKRLVGFLFAAMVFIDGIHVVRAAEEGARKDEGGRPSIDQPVIVNGDTVEYVTERNEITAVGNVRVNYKGTRLTCSRLTVNTVTKDAVAEGMVTIEDANGVMHGERIVYNFNTKKGSVVNGTAASPPFFCRASTISLNGQDEFIARDGYASTCDLDNPHYRVRARKVIIRPGDKATASPSVVQAGSVPVAYLPGYTQRLDDLAMHILLTPGYRKEWGPFLLTGFRQHLTDDVMLRYYLDYRYKLGLAEGIGANYTSPFGRGDSKLYYTHETPTTESLGSPNEFDRGFLRVRHKWDIDPGTGFIAEIYKIDDTKRKKLGPDFNFLKDYFPKEYDLNSQPLSYAQYHHYLDHSSFDVVAQQRAEKWYSSVDILPQVRYTVPSYRLTDGSFPLYFDDQTQAAYLLKRVASPAAPGTQYEAARLDTYNQFSTPFRAGIFELTPFTALRNTAYSSGLNGDEVEPRDVFYVGTSASTKFYRTYETQPHFLRMDVDDIRHIITPSLTYSYNTKPNVPSWELKQFDSIDAINENNSVNLALSNRLQTKRNGTPVSLADFRVNTGYIIYSRDPLTDAPTRGRLSDDILFNLEFYPYSWLSFIGDADYNDRSGRFTTADYDINFQLDPRTRWGFGQRYQYKGGSELTSGLDWMLNPKWTFHVYERYELKDVPSQSISKGMLRQEYGFTRDLHCWFMDFRVTEDKTSGLSFWVVFRLKAFPESRTDFSQSYYPPHPGSR
ncbi:MAG: LPS-assembly protein LptD [Deltaproteobacteria bacterium]